MIKFAIDYGIKFLLCLLASFCLLTCGIEEYYYLPQVEQNRIRVDFNSYAIADIPPIPSEHYYATGYSIYYRIYLSREIINTVTVDNMNLINSSLASDYRAFSTLTDPSNTSSIPTISTFSNQRYYELDYVIDTDGGIFEFWFPSTGINPYVLYSGIQKELWRNNEVYPYDNRIQERFFRNTTELKEPSNSTTKRNMDVASGQTDHAYVAMYIVAVGQNPSNFQNIYSKPTFINVFKLPND